MSGGLIVDFTHVHRPMTGIERVSLDVFSAESLSGFAVEHVRASSTKGLIAGQWLTLPRLARQRPRDLVLCPGFPPSIALSRSAGPRVVTYVHDLFLLTRNQDLNIRAKLYMRPSFAYAVRNLGHFLVNSQVTADTLRTFSRPDAEIRLLRPAVGNVFGLSRARPAEAGEDDGIIRMVTVGTVEPRKNLPAAARLRRALADRLGRPVELHVFGRVGWGEDARMLAAEPDVFLHGYQTVETVRAMLHKASFFISCSKDEGLGLPLLEAQHGGLLIVASDIPVYREVLGDSGCLIATDQPEAAAETVASILARPDWQASYRHLALANVDSWNAAAERDLADAFAWLRRMLSALQ